MLQTYIHKLLYRYDLVIIPDFGGIIGRKKSARYDKATHIFSPPFKDISFNGSLQESDGLLVNYIASDKKITHKEAFEFVQKEVNTWKEELQKNKRLVLEHIGIFSLVNERIIFQPLLTKNFLPESYGLNSFMKKTVKVKQPILDKQLKINNVEDQFFFEEEFKEEPKKSNNNILKYAAIAVVGLAIFGGIAYYFNNLSTSKKTKDYQEASFVVKKDAPAVEVSDSTNINNVTTASDSTATANETNNATDNSNQNETEKTNATDTNTSTNVASTNKSATTSSNSDNFSDKKYQIVVGAFQDKNNADNKVASLKNSGFNAGIAGQNSRGLYMVSLDGFDNFEEANTKLQEVRNQYANAWIYKK